MAKGEATAELQAVFYHPVITAPPFSRHELSLVLQVAKAVIYGRDSMVYKVE